MTHHKLDIKPVPEQVLYVNEPELIYRSLFNLRPYKPEEQVDNIRIYVPLDLNREAIIRRLEDIIEIFEEVNYNNEGNFYVTVGMLIQQIEIYDQIWTVRNLFYFLPWCASLLFFYSPPTSIVFFSWLVDLLVMCCVMMFGVKRNE